MRPIYNQIVGTPDQHGAPLTLDLAEDFNVPRIDAIFAEAVIHLELVQRQEPQIRKAIAIVVCF
jgi:hypothetical protein